MQCCIQACSYAVKPALAVFPPGLSWHQIACWALYLETFRWQYVPKWGWIHSSAMQRGIGSHSRRKAAFPTLFNSLLHTRSWSLSFSLTLLLMFEKIEDRRLYSCAHMWSFDFKVMYGSGLMASVDIQPGVTIWGCLQCHLPTASILPKLCLFSI